MILPARICTKENAKMINGLVLFLFLLCFHGLAADKMSFDNVQPVESTNRPVKEIHILGLNFNQTGESDTLEALTRDCKNIHITAPIGRRTDNDNADEVDSAAIIGSPYEKILKLCEENYAPDIVLISGHYASSWSGNIGSLKLNELETLSCNPACYNFFRKVKHGLFFSCNTLLGAPKKDESPEKYVQRLIQHHGGEFPIDVIIEAGIDMYMGAGGQTNASRIQSIFSDAYTLLGFAGGAPLGAAEGGKSEQGLEEALKNLAKERGDASICSTLENLAGERDPVLNRQLVEQWLESMNKADVAGNDAAYLCADCAHREDGPQGKHIPRDIFCQLHSSDPEVLKQAFLKVMDDKDLLLKLFGKVTNALNKICSDETKCEFLQNISPEKREELKAVAQMRIKVSPLLVHKIDPFRILKILGEDISLDKEFKKYLLDYVSSPKAEERDLFRETIQRAPPQLFASQSGLLFELFERTQDPQLKYDLKDGFAKSLGPYKNRVFHEGVIKGVQFAPDGQRIATASMAGKVMISEIQMTGDWQQVAAIGHEGEVYSAEFSSTGKWVVTAPRDARVKIFENQGKNWEQVAEVKHTDSVDRAKFSPDENWLVTTSWDGKARIFGRRAGVWRKVSEIEHSEYITGVEFSKNSERLVTGSMDMSAKVFELKEGSWKEVGVMNHSSKLVSTQISPDGQRVMSVAEDNRTRIFEAKGDSWQEVKVIERTISADLSADARKVVTAAKNGEVKFFEFQDGDWQQVGIVTLSQEIKNIQFSPDAKRALALTGQRAGLIELKGGVWQEVGAIGDSGAVRGAQFSPNGKRIVTTNSEGIAKITDLEDAIK